MEKNRHVREGREEYKKFITTGRGRKGEEEPIGGRKAAKGLW